MQQPRHVGPYSELTALVENPNHDEMSGIAQFKERLVTYARRYPTLFGYQDRQRRNHDVGTRIAIVLFGACDIRPVVDLRFRYIVIPHLWRRRIVGPGASPFSRGVPIRDARTPRPMYYLSIRPKMLCTSRRSQNFFNKRALVRGLV